jgi:tRNA pseudouridine13 synthase
MKLKQHPDDFFVEELTDLQPADKGAFSLYRLEKTGWSTPDAVAAIRRRWDIELRRFSYGGLKDRHAHTIQHFTVLHGPRRNLAHHGVTVKFLGQVWTPFRSNDIKANAFRIVLRDIEPHLVAGIGSAVEEVRKNGVPNYFDDQRFGSVEEGGEFIGRLLVRGDFEQALRVALAGRYEYDRAEQKKEKATLLAHWRDWKVCKERLPRGHARSLVDYLVSHPEDFRGAVKRLRPELRGLYLSAYQSDLWNRILAAYIRSICRLDQILDVPLRLGVLPMHRNLEPGVQVDLADMRLPLPSARLKLDADSPVNLYLQAVLKEENLELGDLRVKGIRELFFSRGERAALCIPMDMGYEAGSDEAHPGKQLVRLSFSLPRGSYATLVVKRITVFPSASTKVPAGRGV